MYAAIPDDPPGRLSCRCWRGTSFVRRPSIRYGPRGSGSPSSATSPGSPRRATPRGMSSTACRSCGTSGNSRAPEAPRVGRTSRPTSLRLSRRGCRSAERDGRRCGPGRSWRVRPAIPLNRCSTSWIASFTGRARTRWARKPFPEHAGAFFAHLREERGLREASVHHYRHHLAQFDVYLRGIELHDPGPLARGAGGVRRRPQRSPRPHEPAQSLRGRAGLSPLPPSRARPRDGFEPQRGIPAGVSAGDAPARHHVG